MDSQRNHLNKPADKNKCKEIYWNLLHYSKNNSSALPTHFIRELEQTKRCDEVGKDFGQVRENYRSHMGIDTYDKIIAQSKRDEDLEYVATQTVSHFSHWTQKELVSALSLGSKLLYYTENTFAAIGKLTTGCGIFKGMGGAQKVIENYKNSFE